MKLTLSSKNKENQRKMSTANNVTEYTSKITVNIQPMKRYPYCLVWTSVPLITTILPCFGHTGITDSHGTIFDFAIQDMLVETPYHTEGLKKLFSYSLQTQKKNYGIVVLKRIVLCIGRKSILFVGKTERCSVRRY